MDEAQRDAVAQTSAASGGGLLFDPKSFSIDDGLPWTRRNRTFEFGGEYRFVSVDMNAVVDECRAADDRRSRGTP